MIPLLGILGGLLFLVAPLPATIRALKTKNTNVPVDTSLAVCLGNIFQYCFLVLSYGFDLILFLNYSLGFVLWLILLYFGVKRASK